MGKSDNKVISQALAFSREFLKIDDSLKLQRLEWLFGIPQVNSQHTYMKKVKVGLPAIELVSDEYFKFKSGLSKGTTSTDGFLGLLFKAKGKLEIQCIAGVSSLVEMCVEDESVARYVFSQPSPSVQYARYSDWLFPYAESLLTTTQNQMKTMKVVHDY